MVQNGPGSQAALPAGAGGRGRRVNTEHVIRRVSARCVVARQRFRLLAIAGLPTGLTWPLLLAWGDEGFIRTFLSYLLELEFYFKE